MSVSAKNVSAAKKSQEVTKEKLIQDFKIVVADAEALLKATAGQGGDALESVRRKVEESLAEAKGKMSDIEDEVIVKAKEAAAATDEYVHANPWNAVGIAAGVGLLVGLLIGRR